VLADASLSLVSIDRHPAVERFLGLGQLEPEQLAALLPRRAPVEPRHLQAGQEAWQAFRAADTAALESFIADDSGDLPFLGAALT
jgi:hypothetical protein